MKQKRLLSLLLAAILMISALPLSAFATEYGPDYATRGEVVSMLLNAADDYNPGVQESDIIKGYEDGSIRKDQPITRAESFVMVSRAFGDLPTPVGNNLRVSLTDLKFTGVPAWAQADVDKLVAGGILVGTENGDLAATENVTTEQMDTMIRRLFALFAENLKDDYYNTVNKTLLDNSVLRPGEMSSSAFGDLQYQNSENLTKIINDMVAGTFDPGTPEQKVSDFYRSAADIESRNEVGIQPIEGYLKAIDASSSVDELTDALNEMMTKIGTHPLFGFGLTADPKDSTKYILVFSGFSPALTKQDYEQEDPTKKEAYLTYLSNLLTYTGIPEADARNQAENFYNFEKKLSAVMMDRQEYGDIDKIYNLYTFEQLKELFPTANLDKQLSLLNLTVPDKIMVQDTALLDCYATYFTDENLPLLKTASRVNLIAGLGALLDERFIKNSEEFTAVYYGMEGNKTTEEYASQWTQSIMSNYLGQIYVNKYFSDEAKSDVKEMVNEFLEIFKQRIESLDWMSESTKQMATKKLNTMTVKIGYPDSWESPMDKVEIVGPESGKNTLFENYCNIAAVQLTEGSAKQNQPVDKSTWMLAPYTVNAYYNASANEIVFPAGILQAPFYDVNASREENLGGIGTVIAHEITHAFDNNGAKFDENGNAANWWTEEDYSNFQQLCEKAVAYYDGPEVAPGIRNNGTISLSENIADLGGMACALEAMKKIPNADYDKFFRSNARIWYMTSTRSYTEYLTQMDLHSAHKLRCNLTAANYDEFYQTYGITETDGMYTDPESRVVIW